MAVAKLLDLRHNVGEVGRPVHRLNRNPRYRSVHSGASRNVVIVSARTARPVPTWPDSIHSPGVCSPWPRVTPSATAGTPAACAALASVLVAPMLMLCRLPAWPSAAGPRAARLAAAAAAVCTALGAVDRSHSVPVGASITASSAVLFSTAAAAPERLAESGSLMARPPPPGGSSR